MLIMKIAKKDKRLKAIVEDAVKDPELGPIVKRRLITTALCLVDDDAIIGFAIPRKDKDGRHRSGPIYIRPEYRRRGLATVLLRQIFHGVKARAVIAETNIASQRTFEGLGFKRTGTGIYPDGKERYEEWIKNPLTPASEGWLDERINHLLSTSK